MADVRNSGMRRAATLGYFAAACCRVEAENDRVWLHRGLDDAHAPSNTARSAVGIARSALSGIDVADIIMHVALLLIHCGRSQRLFVRRKPLRALHEIVTCMRCRSREALIYLYLSPTPLILSYPILSTYLTWQHHLCIVAEHRCDVTFLLYTCFQVSQSSAREPDHHVAISTNTLFVPVPATRAATPASYVDKF